MIEKYQNRSMPQNSEKKNVQPLKNEVDSKDKEKKENPDRESIPYTFRSLFFNPN